MKAMHPLALALAATTMIPGAYPSMRGSDTDRRIEASAKSSYVYRSCLKDDDIRVDAAGGIVTLTGKQAEKDLVTKLTRDINGVKSVNNNMTVNA